MDDDAEGDYELEPKPLCAMCGGNGWIWTTESVVTDAGTKWQRTTTWEVEHECDRCGGSGLEPWE